MSWIPVEERLPEGDITVMVQGSNGDIFPAWYDHYCSQWISCVQGDDDDDIIAWYHITEPYKKQRRFVVEEYRNATIGLTTVYCVRNTSYKGRGDNRVSLNIPTREAAEKIADIYEEAYRGE